MTIDSTMDERTTTIADILANIQRQARTGRAVWLTAEDAQVLLEYMDTLERACEAARNAIDRSVSGVARYGVGDWLALIHQLRAALEERERIAELERERGEAG